MGDLISRSAIIDWINNHKQPLRYHKQVAGTDGTIFTKEVLTTMQRCIEVFETFINNMPTAYDVDAVVEEMQDSTVEFELFGICSEYIPKHIAINAVRKGGVNE